uniref:Cysteine-rich PDZ-binding protein n=1 Tax=Chromera velia CCMP2878 TaxID=1169474 RepID=A0A0G4HPI4_9ALVE|eukprot:Cvel_29889.t1-p1 / transcript=Cvel_29889.t1 / gene=Cvel_29889 / organism=Chromera_velia_CCMP2878 / gene_product=Cysteine-rich PDZ-binding protein, putative / transcript_product=Cysteine-rich PDZ-binding protein, putative / location=Cvel_scaffold4173:3393-5619(-) / protein_length=92 / sequence_SO=supercontig / SO=protein_coding / is_pseudo=false
MVCGSCQTKLSKLATPDVWKTGKDKREVGGNKVLQNYSKTITSGNLGSKCKVCGQTTPQKGKYCPDCAYKKGRCSMCGKKQVDVSKHNMSMV